MATQLPIPSPIFKVMTVWVGVVTCVLVLSFVPVDSRTPPPPAHPRRYRPQPQPQPQPWPWPWPWPRFTISDIDCPNFSNTDHVRCAVITAGKKTPTEVNKEAKKKKKITPKISMRKTTTFADKQSDCMRGTKVVRNADFCTRVRSTNNSCTFLFVTRFAPPLLTAHTGIFVQIQNEAMASRPRTGLGPGVGGPSGVRSSRGHGKNGRNPDPIHPKSQGPSRPHTDDLQRIRAFQRKLARGFAFLFLLPPTSCT